MTPKQADIYRFERDFNLQHSLPAAGMSPEGIDIVLATHLHFDHAGGFTERAADGSVRPRFPRAQYVVRRGEFEDAMNPNERTKGSYFLENYKPLADHNVLQLVDEDVSIMPGVRVRRTGGHTMHHQVVLHRIGRQDSRLRGRPAADRRASSGSVGDGLRFVPARHAQLQASLPARSHRARVPHPVRARSEHRGRVHSREATGRGTSSKLRDGTVPQARGLKQS